MIYVSPTCNINHIRTETNRQLGSIAATKWGSNGHAHHGRPTFTFLVISHQYAHMCTYPSKISPLIAPKTVDWNCMADNVDKNLWHFLESIMKDSAEIKGSSKDHQKCEMFRWIDIKLLIIFLIASYFCIATSRFVLIISNFHQAHEFIGLTH